MATTDHTRSRNRTLSSRIRKYAKPASKPGKGWRGWLRTNWRTVATLVVVAVALSLLWGRVDIDEVHRRAETVPAGLAFLLMVVLPLVGCPATLVNLAAGVRFGIAGGLPLVALAITLQQVIAFQLVRWKPRMFGHLIDPIRRRLPKGSHASVTVFSALLPGIPYWMQVYAMPLIGVPFRTVLLCAVPLHTVRSLIALVGGDISGHVTAGWLVALGVYAVVLMSVCAWAGRRIRRQLTEPKTPARKRASRSVRASAPDAGEASLDDAALVGGGK